MEVHLALGSANRVLNCPREIIVWQRVESSIEMRRYLRGKSTAMAFPSTQMYYLSIQERRRLEEGFSR